MLPDPVDRNPAGQGMPWSHQPPGEPKPVPWPALVPGAEDPRRRGAKLLRLVRLVVTAPFETIGVTGFRQLMQDHHGVRRARLGTRHRGLLDGDLDGLGLHKGRVLPRKVRPALGYLDKRRAVAVVGAEASFGDVVEEGEEPVEIFLLNRVVLVVVTTRACQGKPQEHGPHRLHSIRHVLNDPFSRDGAALGVDAMVAVETGGHLGVEITVRKKISGHLLDHEPIEGHVRVERLDQPVAPDPHIAQAVILIAIGIGVP